MIKFYFRKRSFFLFSGLDNRDELTKYVGPFQTPPRVIPLERMNVLGSSLTCDIAKGLSTGCEHVVYRLSTSYPQIENGT